jgi:Mannosyltransferase putative
LHQQESGVVIIDKKRRFYGLIATAVLNLPHNRQITYDMHMYGDKETFWMGFESISEPFAFNKYLPGSMGAVAVKLSRHVPSLDYSRKPILMPATTNTFEENPNEENGLGLTNRICSAQLLHTDENGDPIWINGGLFEDKYHGNYTVIKVDKWVSSPVWHYNGDFPCAYFNSTPRDFTDSQRMVLDMSIGIFKQIFVE